jgi:NodT family efflux transporter outer membrane factor (OMF) lipoprotein
MKSIRFTLALVVLAVWLPTGCSLAPDYHVPVTASIPTTFKEAPGWVPAQPADAEVRAAWWRLFNDPVLDGLQKRATAANQNLAAAKAAYDQARALVKEQRASFLPVLGLSTSGNATRPVGQSSGGSRNYAVTIGTTWEPDLWGKVGETVNQAGAQAQASAATLANTALSVQGELALNYVQMRGIEAQKLIYDATIAAYRRALQITQNRYKNGVVQRSDVLQAETALHNALASDADLGRRRALLEHAIAVLVGENPSTFSLAVDAVDPSTATVPDVPGVLPASLLERRPDIAAAERRVAAANANIGIQRSAFFPVLGLTGGVGNSARTLGSLVDVSTSVWSLGLSGALTLLDFGVRSARVEEARAAHEQTAATYRQTVLTAFQQTEDALAATRILATVAAERAAAATAANQAERIANNQYVAGQISYGDVIVTQTTALSARLAVVEAVINRQSAAIALVQAIGGQW